MTQKGHGIIQPGDPLIKENTRKSREWERTHPGRSWRTGLTPERIKELKDQGQEG